VPEKQKITALVFSNGLGELMKNKSVSSLTAKLHAGKLEQMELDFDSHPSSK